MENVSYLKQMLAPSTRKAQGRKVWSLDLDTVIVPALTAGNACGDSAIPHASLGAPLQLAYDKTGAVRFSQSGRPIIRVAKEITGAVALMRENVTASLINYTSGVVKQYPDEFKAQVEANHKAGLPIKRYDNSNLANALKAQAEAEAKAQAEAEAKAQAEAEAKAKNHKRELVTA